MKKKSTSPAFAKATAGRQSTFQRFNDLTRRSHLRVLIGLFVFLAGVFLALVGFGPATAGFAQGGTTREQMAVALAQALDVPIPACVPGQEMFHDVPASSPFCPFIEELVRRGITSGCGGGNYCPGAAVTRAQMAAFLVKVIGLDSHTTETGEANTVTGIGALQSNTTGSFNTADGFQALNSNTTGTFNTANGFDALFKNTEGSRNTATGQVALQANITGNLNTAIGDEALLSNTTGGDNTAIGAAALQINTTGHLNTAVGEAALLINDTGNANVALGVRAGTGVSTASGVICIGANVAGENVSNSCYIGNIFGKTSAGGTAVFVNSLGKLGTTTSSRRFKEEIEPMESASEAVYALKPVKFRYKKEIDPHGISQFGLVAEDVEKINPDLVVRDKEGKPYTVRYDAVNAMLLNEFLKEHKKVEEQGRKGQEQQATIAELKSEIASLTAIVKEQAAQIQKVSAQVQLRPTAATTVANNK